MDMNGHTLRIDIRDDLLKLYKTVVEAKTSEAYAALGRFIYERMEELEAEIEERGQYREFDAHEDPDDVDWWKG